MKRTPAIALFLTALAAPPLHAWKSVTHVHLAMVVRADALDDGRVTIYEMDYANGRFSMHTACSNEVTALGRQISRDLGDADEDQSAHEG